MKIYKVVVDKKPTDCIACPLIKLKLCGKQYTIRGSSGGIFFGFKPDDRCFLRQK